MLGRNSISMNVFRNNFEKVLEVPLLNALPKRELNMNIWATMVSISIPLIGYVGYKTYKWVHEITKINELEYEYYYQNELDKLMETKLDDLENPELADKDTIKIGKKLMAISDFMSFTRNYRKKMVRNVNTAPIIKKKAVPSDQFDWANSYTHDETPKGMVYMRYEPDTESFWYYTKDRNMPYKYLETVARKYVCEYNRLDVFIDIREELKKGAEAMKEQSKEKESDEQVNQKSVYVKFKKYNHKNARANNSSNKRLIVKARANRYSYRGSLEDYENMIIKDRVEENSNPPCALSYSDYIKSINGLQTQAS